MRIPPSVIVMSVLTAVPFGLGIRDTLARQGAPVDEEELGFDIGGKRSAAAAERALADYEAQMRREAEERAARTARRIAQLDEVYGGKPAVMGSLLDGIVLGADAGSFQSEPVRQRLARDTQDGFLHVRFDPDAQALNAVDVVVNADYETSDACQQLARKLEAAWGPATRGVWLDPATHQRAAFDTDDCHLRFDRYLEPAEWVGKLPLRQIGAKPEALMAELGNVIDDSDDAGVWWHMPGVGFGKAATKLEAYVEGGKVIGLRATVDSDFDTALAVRDALSAAQKTQAHKDDATGQWVWSKRPLVRLDTNGSDRFTLLVGKTPWD